jgi:predicted metal-dependent phosphoesterase TrpH
MRFDLHTHTYHSSDSWASPAEIIQVTVRRGLDGLAVTDHNTIDGALELAAMAPFRVIVGEEIKASQGEIIGLFLQEPVAAGLSPEETMGAIHEQGGLVYVPHPMDRLRRRSALSRRALERLVNQIDALEVFNARVVLPRDNQLAREFALAYGLAMGAGSDAHMPSEIGSAYVEVEAFDDAASFLAALRQGEVVGRLASPLVHFQTALTKLHWRLVGKRLAG